MPTSTGPIFRGHPVDHVIDVRSKLEYWLGHLEGAVCIPVGRMGPALAERLEHRNFQDIAFSSFASLNERTQHPGVGVHSGGYVRHRDSDFRGRILCPGDAE